MNTQQQNEKNKNFQLEGQNIQIFNETCPLHKGNQFQYLCTDFAQQDQAFKCIYCVTDEYTKQDSLIPLKQIVDAEEKTIFTNFPLTNRTLTLKIKQIIQKPATSEEIKQQIDQFFKDLTTSILAKIEFVHSNMINKVLNISNLSEQIISMYNAMSEKENLKQIILDESKPSSSDKFSDIKALCKRVLSKDSKNQQAIQAAIEKVATLERAIDFETPMLIKERVLQHLEQIDMFLIEDIENFSKMLKESQQHSSTSETIKAFKNMKKNKLNDISDEQSSQFQDQFNRMGLALTQLQVPVAGSRNAHLYSLTENQTTEIAKLVEQLAKMNQESENRFANIDNELNELKSEELFELISNQTNFCSKEYLNDLKVIFEKMRGVFGLFHIRKLNARTQIQKSFNRLSQAQLKHITILAAKVNQLTVMYGDQYELSYYPQQQTQNNSANLIQQINNSKFKNTSAEEQENIRREFDQLLVNYPIFETLPVIQIERALPSIIFTRSVHGQSSEMGIAYNGSEIKLTLGASKQGQCNSQILNNNRGFSLKITFNRPFGSAKQGGFLFGLILNSQILSNWVLDNTDEAGFYSYLNHGASKIIRGNILTSKELRNITSSLEFRWCVAKRQFFYSDSTYQNINQVKKKHFSPTEKYSFAVYFDYLAEEDWEVKISDFKEIDPNEVDKFN